MPFFEPQTPHIINIDYDKCIPVSVIINFSKDGKMLPLYIRWINNDESEETLKVDSVKYTKDIDGGITYCCYVIRNGWRKEVNLTFYVKECLWVLNK